MKYNKIKGNCDRCNKFKELVFEPKESLCFKCYEKEQLKELK